MIRVVAWYLGKEISMRMRETLESKGKDTAITLRISKQQKNILNQAAKLKHTSLTNFVLQQAYHAAQEALADQIRFSLDSESWDKFCEALDKKPEAIENLKNLFSKKTLLDD